MLGIATFFSAGFLALITAFAFFWLWSFLNVFDDESRRLFFRILAVLLDYGGYVAAVEILSLLVVFVLYGVYRRHLRGNGALGGSARFFWNVLFFFFGPYAMVFYYLRHVAAQPKQAESSLLRVPSASNPRSPRV